MSALKFLQASLRTFYEVIINVSKKLFPLVLGGEHSITSGSIKPFVKKFKSLYILHFDAHADLRESYNGEKFSHASAIRRLSLIHISEPTRPY